MSSELFRVATENDVHVIDLILPDALDAAEFDHLNESLLGVIQGKTEGPWVLDLAQASYMGSAVLGLMVNIRQQIKQSQGKLVLCNLSQRMAEVFRACSLERLFIIEQSRAAAIRNAGN